MFNLMKKKVLEQLKQKKRDVEKETTGTEREGRETETTGTERE